MYFYTLFGFAASIVSLVGATTLTLHDYPSYKDGHAENNPPWCEVAYSSLDLDRVTAYGSVSRDKCGGCINVCGSAGCEYLLVIDQCTLRPDHLDISQGAGMRIVGSDTGNHEVTFTWVDAKNCAGIWSGKMFFDWQAPYGGWAALKGVSAGGAEHAVQQSSTSSQSTLTQAKTEAPYVPSPSPSSSTTSTPAPAPQAQKLTPSVQPVASTLSTASTVSTPEAPKSQQLSTSSSPSVSLPSPAPAQGTSSSSSSTSSKALRVFAESTATGTLAPTTTLGTSYRPMVSAPTGTASPSNATVTQSQPPQQTANAAFSISPNAATTTLLLTAALMFSFL